MPTEVCVPRKTPSIPFSQKRASSNRQNEYSAQRRTSAASRRTSASTGGREEPREVLGRHRARTALVQAVGQGAGMGLPVGKVVLGRQDQSLVQLPGPPRRHLAAQQGRHHLGRRAGRGADAHLPATADRGLQVRQRAEVARRSKGRPRGHLHGHVPRAADRDAGLRAHRRAAHGDLRRLLGQCAGGPHHRFAGRRRHHAGRLLSPRQRSEAEARRGRSAGLLPVGEATSSSTSAPARRKPWRPAATTGGTN